MAADLFGDELQILRSFVLRLRYGDRRYKPFEPYPDTAVAK
jgi:hypothetical protein